jgi:hypothetical protein
MVSLSCAIFLCASLMLAKANINCGDASCSYCTFGYLYNTLCCPQQCPTGYLPSSSQTCIPSSTQNVFSLHFYRFSQFSATSFQGFSSPNGLPFSDSSQNSPVPTKDRGFYFVSTSKLVSGTSWIPGPDITLRFGVSSFTPGTIFEIADASNSYFKLIWNGSAYVVTWLLTSGSGTANFQITLTNAGAWSFFTLNGNQKSTQFTATFGTATATSAGYEFKAQYSGLNFCFGGCLSGSFTGFLHEMILDNAIITSYQSNYKFLFCSDSYFTIPSGGCQGCSPVTWPLCVRASNNLCFSQYCSTCTGYTYAECTACSSSTTAPDCSLGLNCASGTAIFSCTSCQPGFTLIEGLCLQQMPYGYNSSSLTTPVFNLNFNTFAQYYAGIFQSGSNPATYSPVNPENDDPIVLYNRGLYFDGVGMYLQTSSIHLNSRFTIAFWVYYQPVSTYNFLWSSNMLRITTTSFANILMSNAEDSIRRWSYEAYANYHIWFFEAFTVDFVNQTTTVICSENGYAFYHITENTYIGRYYAGGYFMPGFLYSLTMWQTAITDFSSVYHNCGSAAPGSCLNTCSVGFFYAGNSMCAACPTGCSSTCVSATICDLCNMTLCTQCSGFYTCGVCVANAVAVNGVCACQTGFYSTGVACLQCDFSCSTCYGSEYYQCSSCSGYLLENVCLNRCPVGFEEIEHNCNINNNPAVWFDFSSVEGVTKDKIQGIIGVTGNDTNYYPNMNPTDPIPVYGRGIYFDGTQTYFSFASPNSNRPLLGSSYFISIWLNPYSADGILGYKGSSSNMLKVFYQSASLGIAIKIDSSIYSFTGSKILDLQQWTHLLFCVSYAAQTWVQVIANAALDINSVLTAAPYIDSLGTSLQIGISTSSIQSFRGFVYSYQIFIIMPLLPSLISSKCDSCQHCPSNQVCISDCSILQYWNNDTLLCSECLSNCTTGCRNSINCSLCSDPNCKTCSGFEEKTCIQCEIGYDLLNSSCFSCNSSSYYDDSLLKCIACPNLCKVCPNANACTECAKNSHINSNNQCECDPGYTLNNTCERSLFHAFLKVQADNTVQIVFEKPLLTQLTQNSIKVTIQDTQQTCSVNIIDDFIYQISINFTSDIQDMVLVNVHFLDKIQANDNSLLIETKLSSTLFPQSINNIANEIKDMKLYTQQAMKYALYAILGTSAINVNPSSLFYFLNAAEIYSYIPVYDLSIDPVLLAFLASLQPTSNMPNLFSYLLSASDGTQMIGKFNDFGYTSNLFMINSGVAISIILITISAYLLLLPFKVIKNQMLRKYYDRLVQQFTYAVFLRIWIQTCLEFSVTSLVSLLYSDHANYVQILDFSLSLVVLVIPI